MSLQSIVPYHLNGEQYFTHTSWFSEKQYNAWNNIPIENHNLAIYSGLSTVAVIGIVNLEQSSSLEKGWHFSTVTEISSLDSVLQLLLDTLDGWLSSKQQKLVKLTVLSLRMSVGQPLFGGRKQLLLTFGKKTTKPSWLEEKEGIQIFIEKIFG